MTIKTHVGKQAFQCAALGFSVLASTNFLFVFHFSSYLFFTFLPIYFSLFFLFDKFMIKIHA